MTRDEFVKLLEAYQRPDRPSIEQINAALLQVAMMLNEYVEKELEFQQAVEEMQKNK